MLALLFNVFFFNDTATTEIYTLSLHDALPICPWPRPTVVDNPIALGRVVSTRYDRPTSRTGICGSANAEDRKSTRLNSSHANISYAVFCLTKKYSYTHPPTSRSTDIQLDVYFL